MLRKGATLIVTFPLVAEEEDEELDPKYRVFYVDVDAASHVLRSRCRSDSGRILIARCLVARAQERIGAPTVSLSGRCFRRSLSLRVAQHDRRATRGSPLNG